MIDTASYGKALYQLTAENGSDARVLEELDAVERLLKENPSYTLLRSAFLLPASGLPDGLPRQLRRSA